MGNLSKINPVSYNM